MNRLSINSLKLLRKLHENFVRNEKAPLRNYKMYSNKIYTNDLVKSELEKEKGSMIARFGSTELLCLSNYIGVEYPDKDISKFIKGETLPWWWEKSTIDQMKNWSGFFPADVEYVERFCELMIEDMKYLDILATWQNREELFSKNLEGVKRVVLEDLEPFFTPNPWTHVLEGRKVLVVHPFDNSIGYQYKRRKKLFDNNLLPDFKLITLQAVQSLGGTSQFSTWFEALQYLKDEIDKIDYDICILGCGAYGFPLAAHIKRTGKKAIHMGGVTQMLFGIKGRRWENVVFWPYMNLFNDYWIRPGSEEIPNNAKSVEGACYW